MKYALWEGENEYKDSNLLEVCFFYIYMSSNNGFRKEASDY